jgi:hypothetical protein
MAKAILLALSLTILNAVVSLIIINYSMKKDWKKLYKLVFGSMTVRYFLTTSLVWFCLRYFVLNAFAFALTFLISTFILIFVEILFIHIKTKSLSLKNRN